MLLVILTEDFEFGILKDDLIRDRIVVGLKDKKLSEKLQLDSKIDSGEGSNPSQAIRGS